MPATATHPSPESVKTPPPAKIRKKKSTPALTRKVKHPDAEFNKAVPAKFSKKQLKRAQPLDPFATRDCLCGCGSKVVRYFVRGHIKRWNAGLKQCRQGAKPTSVFDEATAKQLGPWKTTKGGGFVPTNTYMDLR